MASHVFANFYLAYGDVYFLEASMTNKQALKLALAALETLDMLLWYEPVSKTYRVMRYEDELMEVVR